MSSISCVAICSSLSFSPRLACGGKLQLGPRPDLGGPAQRVQQQPAARRDQRGQMLLARHHHARDADRAGAAAAPRAATRTPSRRGWWAPGSTAARGARTESAAAGTNASMSIVCVDFGYAALISSSLSTTYSPSPCLTPRTMLSLSISRPVRLVDALVAHRLHRALVEPVEVDVVVLRRRVQRDRDVHQPEADGAFPYSAWHGEAFRGLITDGAMLNRAARMRL